MTRKTGKREIALRSPFGRLLQMYRQRSLDPTTGGHLTQERLAELLGREANLPGYSFVDVSRWEKGGKSGRVISQENRKLLLGLVSLLHLCGGVNSLDEANALLRAGDYRELNNEEATQIDVAWRSVQAAVSPDGGQSVTIHGRQFPFNNQEPIQLPTPALFRNTPAPFMVPSLPPQGVFGRDELLTSIYDLLHLDDEGAINTPPLALRGMGGIGKTTLSIAFGRLSMIRERFPDGILWVALGPEPTTRFLQEDWGRALGIDLLPERDESTCRHRLQEALYDRRVLLIVDDVWEIHHGKQFEVAGPAGCTLFTTRELEVAHHLATRDRTLKVDILSQEAALQLLRHLAPESAIYNETVAHQLCDRLEYLPLALTLAGRLLANEADVPSRMQRLLDELLERREARLQLLQADGRLGIDEENPVSLQAILGMSVDRLVEVDRQRFAMASVFGGEPLTWELDLASHVWECTLAEAEDTVAHFIQRGLAERQENGRYWMHALLADYAQELMDEMGL